MVYVDSDGVMANFKEWVNEYSNGNYKNLSVKEVDLIMIDNYKTVFLTSKECNNASKYLDMIRENECCRVLTALPSVNRLRSEFPLVSDIEYRVSVMKENKYKWFEERGIPREKVIITNRSSDKSKYCKSPADVLFDDWGTNIENWREAGGVGCLVV